MMHSQLVLLSSCPGLTHMVSETTTVFNVLALLGCAVVKVDSECTYRQVMHFWMMLQQGSVHRHRLLHVSLKSLVLGA